MAKFGPARDRAVSREWLFAALLGMLLAISRPALAESVSFPSLDGSLTGGKPTLLSGS